MKTTFGTYLSNSPKNPIQFGEINIINPFRRKLRRLLKKKGKLCKTVMTGFWGYFWTEHGLISNAEANTLIFGSIVENSK